MGLDPFCPHKKKEKRKREQKGKKREEGKKNDEKEKNQNSLTTAHVVPHSGGSPGFTLMILNNLLANMSVTADRQ